MLENKNTHKKADSAGKSPYIALSIINHPLTPSATMARAILFNYN